MLAPNKQNLILLKSQKSFIQKGHKLLKEKRSGLIIAFLDLAQKGKELERKLASDLDQLLDIYEQNLTFVSATDLSKSLPKVPCSSLAIKKKKFSGVSLAEIEYSQQVPFRSGLKRPIAKSLSKFGRYFEILLQLSQIKANCIRLAKEITKTNRQIASLEKRIKNTGSQIKFISNSLNEKANLEKANLINLFK